MTCYHGRLPFDGVTGCTLCAFEVLKPVDVEYQRVAREDCAHPIATVMRECGLCLNTHVFCYTCDGLLDECLGMTAVAAGAVQ